MMTLKQIETNATRDRLVLSREITIANLKSGRLKGTNQAMVKATAKSTTHPKTGERIPNPRIYELSVKALTEDKPITKSYIEVSCSCDDFVYYGWEYALAKRGAAKIKYGNGKAADVRNPSAIPGACKHILALFRVIKQRGL